MDYSKRFEQQPHFPTFPALRSRHRAEVRELIATDPTLRSKPAAQITTDARTMSPTEWKDAIDAVTGLTRGGKKFETMPHNAPPCRAYDVAQLNNARRNGVAPSSSPAARPMNLDEYNRSRRGVR
jgi:hypothetical protein